MSTTYQLYPGDGEQTDFQIPFSFLSDNFIAVSVDGTEVPFEFIHPNTARVTPAPANGSTVRVFRRTDRSELVALIPSAGAIRGSDINLQSRQTLDIASEAFDALDDTLGKDLEGQFDAEGDRIRNVSDPEEDGDVVNRGWVENTYSIQFAIIDQAAQEAEDERERAELAAERAEAIGAFVDETTEPWNLNLLEAYNTGDPTPPDGGGSGGDDYNGENFVETYEGELN